jgi:ABC-type sugar transport system ATPase subunit
VAVVGVVLGAVVLGAPRRRVEPVVGKIAAIGRDASGARFDINDTIIDVFFNLPLGGVLGLQGVLVAGRAQAEHSTEGQDEARHGTLRKRGGAG